MSEPIVIERTWATTADVVWDLWTTKEGFESWWGPRGFRAEVSRLDARAGGALHYEMIADTDEMRAAMTRDHGGPSHAVRSRFAVFEPRTRLSLVSVIDFLPGVPPYDSTIDVQLVAAGGRVRMVVTLSPMHAPEMSKMQAEGFTSQLSKLDERFGA